MGQRSGTTHRMMCFKGMTSRAIHNVAFDRIIQQEVFEDFGVDATLLHHPPDQGPKVSIAYDCHTTHLYCFEFLARTMRKRVRS